MGSLSIWHWLIVLVVVLLIFGTKKLRNIGSDLGGAVKGFKEGMKEDAPKIGEEATETVMAAKDGQPEKIIYEVADLWFHTLVLLAHKGLKPADVLNELARREGLSGLEEKANRHE